MATNWNKEKYDCLTVWERRARRYPRARPESRPTSIPQINHAFGDGTAPRSTPGYTQWFAFPSVMLATLAGTMIILFFVASLGILESAMILTGLLAAAILVIRLMRLP